MVRASTIISGKVESIIESKNILKRITCRFTIDGNVAFLCDRNRFFLHRFDVSFNIHNSIK